MKKKITIEIICFLFVLLFTYAAISKLLSFDAFILQISKSPLLTNFAGIVAWIIPVIELLIVSIFAVTPFRKIGMYASFSLMVIFTTYIITLLLFSEKLPCSCGGVLSSLGWTEHLIFNISFTLLGAVGIVFQSQLEEKKETIMTKLGIVKKIQSLKNIFKGGVLHKRM